MDLKLLPIFPQGFQIKIFIHRRANYPWKNIKSIIKEGDSSGSICNCRGPYDEKLVQSLWQRRAKPTIHSYLFLTHGTKEDARRDVAAFPMANDTDSLGMTVGANSKFLTDPIYCVLNINIISVRVDFWPIEKGVPQGRSLGTQITANSKYWLWLMEVWRALLDVSFLCSTLLFFFVPTQIRRGRLW